MRLHDYLDYHAREHPNIDFAVLGDRRVTYWAGRKRRVAGA